MERYFESEDAIASYSGGKIEGVLETIARRYMGANLPYDYIARPYFPGEIIRNSDYRYDADFDKIFPGTANGSYVYAWGKYRAEAGGALKFTLIPKGPVKIWMNGELVFNTTVESERYANFPLTFDIPIKKGWNNLVLRFTKTAAGFGAEFGTWLGKLCYYFFRGLGSFSPDRLPDERFSPGHFPADSFPAGLANLPSMLIEGFDITRPLPAPLEDPSPQNLAPLCLPLPSWTEAEKSRGLFGRIFPEARPGDKAWGRTEIFVPAPGSVVFSGYQSGNCSLYEGSKFLKSFKEAGPFSFKTDLERGPTQLAVLSTCPGEGGAAIAGHNTPGGGATSGPGGSSGPGAWDFSLELKMGDSAGDSAGELIPFHNPFFDDKGRGLSWIYAGPFNKTPGEEICRPFDRELLVGDEGERTFWRLDLPNCWVRLYNENLLYGHWNYPLGVTLYGLMETARLFEKSFPRKEALGAAIASYVESHGAKSVRTLDYALFDKEHFGGATAVHHLLTSIDSLDDCGSFGSLILELARDRDIGDFAKPADYTADHILNKQDRREEGCFWRREMMHHFHNGTLWADDLYMSVPFLCRYSLFKKDPAILDLAALQFEGFKKYLYIEEKKLMAHVFDFARNMNNRIPWGRGNGWTIFSLTELLMVLPADHPRRSFLLGFYRDLAAGYLACQDANGMWHQVLDMPSSYIESSCTAMFICAFSRGIRHGWFAEANGQAAIDTLPYRRAAEKAWQALENYSIDREGNIHGVCRGSEFAFNPRYYAEHLLPRLNDTHGIGIVLLAGAELLKLQNN